MGLIDQILANTYYSISQSLFYLQLLKFTRKTLSSDPLKGRH